ncbi:hypothetical protein E2C01_065912 [Portunus trituberculatus]|uniref:Uncharacterized protein n=1 Tax=Portunus trituberculatus TaxID=210409 RepID=A0A5B7HSH4_PORTR|nr:hypothetical protein [Portunus trituberculatus]
MYSPASTRDEQVRGSPLAAGPGKQAGHREDLHRISERKRVAIRVNFGVAEDRSVRRREAMEAKQAGHIRHSQTFLRAKHCQSRGHARPQQGLSHITQHQAPLASLLYKKKKKINSDHKQHRLPLRRRPAPPEAPQHTWPAITSQVALWGGRVVG